MSGTRAPAAAKSSLEPLAQTLSPIDKYICLSYLANDYGLFHHTYEDWRLKRINKLLAIYGLDYFKGKKVLELAGGHCDIGAFLADIGADVLCLEGRAQNVQFASLKHRRLRTLKIVEFNLEEDFSSFGHFDLIIHFGLLYHLKNVDKHLENCFGMTNDLILETVVLNSLDPLGIIYCDERTHVDEEALEGVGCRPSPFYVERIAEQNGFETIRYFDADLNSGAGQFYYDWEHKNDGNPGDNFRMRQFWRFRRQASVQQK